MFSIDPEIGFFSDYNSSKLWYDKALLFEQDGQLERLQTKQV